MRFAIGLIVTIASAGFAGGAAAQAQGPCFYAAPNFQGQPMCIGANQRVPALGAMNDRLMSVQIPRGVRVTMCSDANFGGQCASFTESIPNFAAMGAAGRVSSVIAEPAGPGGPRPGPAAGAPPQGGSGQPRGQGFTQQPGPPSGPAPGQRGPQYGAQQPLPPPGQHGGPPPRGDGGDPRARMFELRERCEGGDTRACVRLGIIIGENRERRAQWQREHPELFWWER